MIMIRAGAVRLATASATSWPPQDTCDASAARVGRADRQIAAAQACTVMHEPETHSFPFSIAGMQAPPIVDDRQLDSAVVLGKADLNLCGATMLYGVCNRFLSDAVQVRGDERIVYFDSGQTVKTAT